MAINSLKIIHTHVILGKSSIYTRWKNTAKKDHIVKMYSICSSSLYTTDNDLVSNRNNAGDWWINGWVERRKEEEILSFYCYPKLQHKRKRLCLCHLINSLVNNKVQWDPATIQYVWIWIQQEWWLPPVVLCSFCLWQEQAKILRP